MKQKRIVMKLFLKHVVAAARMHEEAVAYKNEVTARAEGEANRFNQLLVRI